jgi:hypothetical protein
MKTLVNSNLNLKTDCECVIRYCNLETMEAIGLLESLYQQLKRFKANNQNTTPYLFPELKFT